MCLVCDKFVTHIFESIVCLSKNISNGCFALRRNKIHFHFPWYFKCLGMRKPRLLLKTVFSNLAEDEVRDIAWAAHDLSPETLNLSSLKNIMSLLRIYPLHQILVNIPYLFFTVRQQHSVKNTWSSWPSSHKYSQKLRGKLFLSI